MSGRCDNALVLSCIPLNMVQEKQELSIFPVAVHKPQCIHYGFLDSSNPAGIKRQVGHSFCFKELYLGVGKPYFMETKILNQGLQTVKKWSGACEGCQK